MHRGVPPWTAWAGLEEPPWPSRGEALCKAFAIHAAEIERTTPDLLDAIGSIGDDLGD